MMLKRRIHVSLFSALITAGLLSAGCDTPTDSELTAEGENLDMTATGEATDNELETEATTVENLLEQDVPEEIETAIIRGTITASTEPSNGGIGDVYIAVTETSPLMGPVEQLAGVIVEGVDFSEETAQVDYEITVPVAKTVFVTALLDDNGNATASDPPGPDLGDLISLIGLDPPSLDISEPGDYVLDLDLNFAFPF